MSTVCPAGYALVNGKCVLRINPTPGDITPPDFEPVCPDGYVWNPDEQVCERIKVIFDPEDGL